MPNCGNCNSSFAKNAAYNAFYEKFYDMYKVVHSSDLQGTFCKDCLEVVLEDIKTEIATNPYLDKKSLLEKNNNDDGTIEYQEVKYNPLEPWFRYTKNDDKNLPSGYFGNKNIYSIPYNGFQYPKNTLDGVYMLPPESQECKDVCTRFYNPQKILFVEKNLSESLYKRFVKASSKINKYTIVNLFHGSDNGNYDSIIKSGFSLSCARDGLLGKGIYGAMRSDYSEHYARTLKITMTEEIKKCMVNKELYSTEEKTIQVMLLCDFILSEGMRHNECTTGDTYAVFSEDFVYPGYLVYFIGYDYRLNK